MKTNHTEKPKGATAVYNPKTGDLVVKWSWAGERTEIFHHEWEHQAQKWCDKRGIDMSTLTDLNVM